MFLYRVLSSRSKVAVLLSVVMAFVGNFGGAALLGRLQRGLLLTAPQIDDVAGYAALCSIVLLTRIVGDKTLLTACHRAALDVRLSLYSQILNTPLAKLETIGPSGVMSVVTEDIGYILTVLPGIVSLPSHLALILGITSYLLWCAPTLLLVAVIPIVAAVAVHRRISARGRALILAGREKSDILNRHHRALTEGLKDLKSSTRARKRFLSEYITPSLNASADNSLAANRVYVLSDNLVQGMFFLVAGVFAFCGPLLPNVSREQSTVCVLAALFLGHPIEFVMSWMPNYHRMKTAIRRIERFSTDVLSVAEGATVEANLSFRELQFKGVTYEYVATENRELFTVGPVDLTIRGGSVTFVIGANGSGKTTFGKMLVGLYPCISGTVLLDGNAVEDYASVAQRLVASTWADSYLFEGPLNAVRDDTTEQGVLRSLRLDSIVSMVDGRFSSTSLSQGQRKRLLLADALLSDKSLFLFDEWAAEQDPESRDFFYNVLLPGIRSRGKTAVVISHDLRYVNVADQVLVFENGRARLDRPGAQNVETSSTVSVEGLVPPHARAVDSPALDL